MNRLRRGRGKRYKPRLTQAIQPINAAIVMAFVGVFLVGGLVLLMQSHAATSSFSLESEQGQITGDANVESDTTASNGSAVRLNNIPTVKVANGHLVNSVNQPIRPLGVDVSGTEDACVQNKGFSWIPRTTSFTSVAAGMRTWNIHVVRVQMNEDCWLGINGVPAAYSGQNYQTYIKNWVGALQSAGIVVVLDLHWAAPGTYSADRQWPMADADHSLTFWTQVATAYKNDTGVMYDLFNEPSMGSTTPTADNWQCWLKGCDYATTSTTYATAGMQAMVDTVRATGAKQPIMVGGLSWAGDPCGIRNSGGNGGACTQIAMMPTDPLNQLVISFHTYNWTACTSVKCWDTVSQAATTAKLPIVTGEFGERDCTANYIQSYMNWADQHNVSYIATEYNININKTGTCSNDLDTLQMLQKWDGTPSPISPEGPVFKAHLLGASQ